MSGYQETLRVLGLMSAVMGAGAMATPAAARDLIIIEGPIVAKNVKCSKCVGTGDLAKGAVASSRLKAGAVTGAKIAPSAVTGAKIRDGSVTAADLAPGVIPGGPGDLFKRTLLVSPVGDGADPALNGDELLAAAAFLDTVSPPPGLANRWLLKIEPGIYDLGDGTLLVRPWIDVEGSGPTVTLIRGDGGSTAGSAAVEFGNLAGELRNLTVMGEGVGTDFASAIVVDQGLARIRNVEVVTRGSSGAVECTGIGVFEGGSLDLSRSRITVDCPNLATGIGINFAPANSSPSVDIRNVQITVLGGDSLNRGILMGGGTRARNGAFRLSDVLVEAGSAGAAGAAEAVRTQNVASLAIRNADLKALSSSGAARGVVVENSAVTVEASHVEASGITADVSVSSDAAAVNVAGTFLGAPVARVGNGTVTCAGVYDLAYNFLPDTCPTP